VPVPEESLHAATPRVANAIAAESRRVLLIVLISSMVSCIPKLSREPVQMESHIA
jgi:hypothetical protein